MTKCLLRVTPIMAATLILLSGGPAMATLISQDLFGRGDGKITLDTSASLQWLDVTETQGLSVNEVLAGATAHSFPIGGWIEDGWRFATLGEVCGLLEPFTGPMTTCSGQLGPFSNEGIAELQSFIGITTTEPATPGPSELTFLTEGSFASGTASFVRSSNNIGAAAVVSDFAFDPSSANPRVGNYLVRPVPEAPISYMLLGLTLGLATARTARQRSRRIPVRPSSPC